MSFKSANTSLKQQLRVEKASNLASVLEIKQKHEKLCSKLQHSQVRETSILLKTNPALRDKKVMEVLESFQAANRELDTELSRPVELKINKLDQHHLQLLQQKMELLQESERKLRDSVR